MNETDPLRLRGFSEGSPWRSEPAGPPLAQRVLLIGAVVGALAFALYALERTMAAPAAGASVPRMPVLVEAGPPIPAEAQVFRTRPDMLAAPPGASRRADAHPRTLATYRLLRSYPGAPPRVPHGLTTAEFRGERCNTCHERGGYSLRFGAYAPVTPHPGLSECLQCHATSDAEVGVPLPRPGSDDTCRQCHSGTPSRFSEAGLDWRAAAWPGLSVRVAGPPPIPHDLALRGNCQACHVGPAAEAEIRTSHPERADCRQCHVEAAGAGTYVRPPAPSEAAAGGAR